MRAAVMRNKGLVVADIPLPEPGPGEVLVKTLACGICGSDLHALKHAEKFVEASRRAGSAFTMDLAHDVVMGHEFCAEIVEHGPANLQFVLGYTADEFAATLRHIAEGAIPTEPLITGKIGIDGVAQAFEDLASPERHAKILVEPWRPQQ